MAIALSNHPNIHCLRGELTHRRSTWTIIPKVTQRLQLAWSQQGYDISMCKIIHGQVRALWSFISAYDPPVKIICLERLDTLAQALSVAVNRLHLDSHPTHTFKRANPRPVILDPQVVVDLLGGRQHQVAETKRLIAESGLLTLFLTYEEITDGRDVLQVPPQVTRKICEFLEVPVLPLLALTRKVHKAPFSEWVSNWDEVLKAVDDVCLRDN